MQDLDIIREGKNSEFWRLICKAVERRIETTRNKLEEATNYDMVKFFQKDIKDCREFMRLPQIMLTHAESQAKEKEK